MRNKKINLVILITLLLTSTYNVLAYDTKIEAENFIKSESSMRNSVWFGENPQITKETPFYSDDEKKASYMEYKVSCRTTKDCGYVFVNLDGTDTTIPMASLTGKTPSEEMENKGVNKNYYFGIFDQYAISNYGEINSTDPENKLLNNGENIYSRGVDTNPLFEKFLDLQQNSVKTKVENKEIQKELKQKVEIQTRANEEATFISILNVSKTCKSPTPCYKQGTRAYGNDSGPTGCVAVAASIVLGYYDRNGYPNILRNVLAPTTNNNTILSLQTDLGDLMGTYLDIYGYGSTAISNTKNGFKYLDGKYKYTSSFLQPSWYNSNDYFLSKIKSEINNKRPIILHISYGNSQGIRVGHSIVGYGYKGNNIYTNFGRGENHEAKILNINGKDFTGYGENSYIQGLTTLTIKK